MNKLLDYTCFVVNERKQNVCGGPVNCQVFIKLQIAIHALQYNTLTTITTVVYFNEIAHVTSYKTVDFIAMLRQAALFICPA